MINFCKFSRSDFRSANRSLASRCVVNSHVRVISRVCARNEFAERVNYERRAERVKRSAHLHPAKDRYLRRFLRNTADRYRPYVFVRANGSALNPSRPRTSVTSRTALRRALVGHCSSGSSRFSPRRQRLPDHPDSVSPVLLIRVSASSASGS